MKLWRICSRNSQYFNWLVKPPPPARPLGKLNEFSTGRNVPNGPQTQGVSKVPQVVFQLYSGNTNEGLKGGKAHGRAAKIYIRNSWQSKVEMSLLHRCVGY